MRVLFCLLLMIFTPFLGLAQESKLVITNTTIIPMHVNQTYANRDVFMEDGKIVSIKKHDDKAPVVEGYKVVDGSGKYLLPGFADAHAHLPSEEDVAPYLWMNLVNGVTAVRSMRGKDWHLELREKIDNGLTAPKLFLSAPAISRRDSFSQSSADELIGKYKEDGYDFVKVLSVKDKETFDMITTASKKHGFFMAGHCPRNVGIFNLSKTQNYHSIEHLGGLFALPDRETLLRGIEETIANNVFHSATLDWYYTGQVVEDELRKRDGVAYLPKEKIKKWETKIESYYKKSDEEKRVADRAKSKKKFDARLSYLSLVYRQGGSLLVSPDASGIYSVPGYGMHTEMQHFAQADISNYDILKSACYNMAVMFEQEKEWGTIKEGVNADLVLLSKNPLTDIKNTDSVVGIVLNGAYLTKEFMEGELKKAAKKKKKK